MEGSSADQWSLAQENFARGLAAADHRWTFRSLEDQDPHILMDLSFVITKALFLYLGWQLLQSRSPATPLVRCAKNRQIRRVQKSMFTTGVWLWEFGAVKGQSTIGSEGIVFSELVFT